MFGVRRLPPRLRARVPTLTPNRHNFLALLGDYLFFGIALTGILNPDALPSDFIARAGGGPVLIGLAGIIFPVAWHLPQILFAWRANRAVHKKPYVTFPAIPARVIFIIVGLLIMVVGPEHPTLLIILLLASYAIFATGDACSVVGWMDILGSSLSDRARARLLGWGHAAYNLLIAVLISPLVRLILGADDLPFPANYAVLLMIAGVLLTVALLSFVRVKEGPSPPPDDSPLTFRQYVALLRRILREDRQFRRYLVVRFVYSLVEISVPFYIVFATSILGQESATAIGDQVLLVTTTGVLAGLGLGYLSERYGTRLVIVIGALAALLHPLLAWNAGAIGMALTWITLKVARSANVIGFLNWLVEYSPEGYRPIYSGVTNTISAVALFAPFFGGLIVQAFSYQALFGVAAALGGLALILVLRLPEPRRTPTAERAVPQGAELGG